MNRRKTQIRIKYSVLIILILFLFAGSAAGSFIELKIDDDSKNGALEYIDKAVSSSNNVDKAEIFKESFKNNGKLLLFIAIGGLSVVLFPAVFAVALYKGVSLGFTSALILEGNGKEGIISCGSSLLLHNSIFIAIIVIYGYFTVTMAEMMIRKRHQRDRMRIYVNNLKIYTLVSIGALIFLIVGACTEAYINPLIVGLI